MSKVIFPQDKGYTISNVLDGEDNFIFGGDFFCSYCGEKMEARYYTTKQYSNATGKEMKTRNVRIVCLGEIELDGRNLHSEFDIKIDG